MAVIQKHVQAFAVGDQVRVKGSQMEQLALYGREVAGAVGTIFRPARRSNGGNRYLVHFPRHIYVTPVKRMEHTIEAHDTVIREEHLERVMTNETLGTIQRIEEVHGVSISPVAPLEGSGGRLGFSAMLNALSGRAGMDGYTVVTDKHTYNILIDNEQSCCESWGYFTSEDDLTQYVEAELREVRLTDTALNSELVENVGADSLDEGAIQFVDFVTDKGTFQIAVYNGHNGYYGHGVVVARDSDILLSDTL